MISVNDFKTGQTIELDGSIWQVLEFQHVKPGKGAAFVRSKLKNLENGNTQEKTFRAGEKVNTAHLERRPMQYLYSVDEDHTFMDTETYDQLDIPGDTIKEATELLKRNSQETRYDYDRKNTGLEYQRTLNLK